MENYKNLNFSAEQINQKLAWVGDKSKLATTLQETPVNQFMFTKDQKTLKTIIDANNQIITVETNDMITEPGSKLESWNVYVDHLLCINSIACEGTMCSHNYVELGNGSKKDINLNGLYLLYTDCSKRLESDIGYVWQYLPLTGVIKAGSTYSFNYGKYHFVSLNSEYAQASSKMYKNKDIDSDKGDITFAQAVNAAIEEWFIKDLKLWKQTEEFPTGCEKCIVYTHDAPFSIVTYDFMNTSTTARAGSKLNTINNNGTYRFSRLFKKMGIRLVMAGHKHTYGISKPIYDAPIEYLEGNKASSAVDILSGEITTDMSRKPVIQVLRQDQVQVNNFARYEVVENITAPTYVTCQATGYKLISNKEQPSGDAYRIPWLLAYFPAATSSSNPKENTAQHKPMYIKYDVSDTNIKITAVQINGIWEVDSSSTKYDFNNQIENLTIDKMTLSTSTEEDLAIYSPDNQNFYTLKLQ